MKKIRNGEKILDENFLTSEVEVAKYSYSWFVRIIFLTLSSLLWIANLMCLSYWFRAALHLGWLPIWAHPDPKDLGWTTHDEIAGYGIGIIFFTFFFWLASFVAFLSIDKNNKWNAILLYGILSIAVSASLIFGDFFAWWAD